MLGQLLLCKRGAGQRACGVLCSNQPKGLITKKRRGDRPIDSRHAKALGQEAWTILHKLWVDSDEKNACFLEC